MVEIISAPNHKIEVPKYVNLPYRRGVGIMVVNSEKKIFVGKRIDTRTDAWQMPQGGIDDDESTLEAGLRELREETNIRSVEVIAETHSWLYYDVPEFLINKLWDGRYRGQKQKWLLVKFTGQNAEIDITKNTPEFENWKWINLDQLPSIVVTFKRQLYLSVVEEFRPLVDKITF